MAKVASYQNVQLEEIKRSVENALPKCETGTQRNGELLFFLEQVASSLSGFNIKAYHKLLGINKSNYQFADAKEVAVMISRAAIPASVLLGILAVEELDDIEQKNKGVYYTDYRLAYAMATSFVPFLKKWIGDYPQEIPKIIDVAAGSGILLCAFLEKAKEFIPIDQLISSGIYAADISAHAIRATLLSIASYTNNMKTITSLHNHILHADSLTNKQQLFKMTVGGGFDLIIGNPPWEKLKLTRHEFDVASGSERHYGMAVKKLSKKKAAEFANKKAGLKKYAKEIDVLTSDIKGEKDLYMIFLKLAMDLLKENGEMVQLVPASFIRNQQTAQLRKKLTDQSASLTISLFDNKAKFFEIDPRFKFIIIHLRKGSKLRMIKFGIVDSKGLTAKTSSVKMDISALKTIREDLSIPEVRNINEWKLFERLSSKFQAFGNCDSIWAHTYSREIDMTLDRHILSKDRTIDSLPVIEGRMIHQYATGVKAYVSGSGRQAIWTQCVPNASEHIKSQFYVDPVSLNSNQRKNLHKWRVGFCDITGQTNERTMLAAYVPPSCICGNKVPTIDFFYEDNFEDLSLLWLAIANSFVFDWLIRKVITTSANFFIVDSIPVPSIDFNDPRYKRIIHLVRKLIFNYQMKYNWETAELRAEIEALVATLYQVNNEEMKMILLDFPIIDKMQPPIKGELVSTVTRDQVILHFLEISNKFKTEVRGLRKRILLHKSVGALPFVPSQFQISDNIWPKQNLHELSL